MWTKCGPKVVCHTTTAYDNCFENRQNVNNE